jgi:hypothetical protein
METRNLRIKLSKGQLFTVSAILIALTSVSYQLYLLRKQNKQQEMGEAYFVYPEN